MVMQHAETRDCQLKKASRSAFNTGIVEESILYTGKNCRVETLIKLQIKNEND